MLVVDAVGVGFEFKLSRSDQALLSALLPFQRFLVDQQVQTFGKGEAFISAGLIMLSS